MKTFESFDHALRFSYPANLPVVGPGDSSTTIEIPGLFTISRIPYSDFSSQHPIFDYESCCTGRRYWYEATQNAWYANTIQPTRYDAAGNPIPDPKDPYPLSSNGTCNIEQKFGTTSFYKIKSGDEGVTDQVYYFLLTDQGYAFRFSTSYDLKGDYSGYAESVRPDPNMLQAAAQVLSSVALSGRASVLEADCL